MKQPRKLHVKRTTPIELSAKWTIDVTKVFINQRLYIKCNAKGEVKWDKAPVYTDEEMFKRTEQIVIL